MGGGRASIVGCSGRCLPCCCGCYMSRGSACVLSSDGLVRRCAAQLSSGCGCFFCGGSGDEGGRCRGWHCGCGC